MKILKTLLDSTGNWQAPMKERILLVESDEQDAAHCCAALVQANFEVSRAINCAQSYDLLSSNNQFHAIVTDFYLADGTAVEILRFARQRSPETIGIVLANEVDESLLLEAIDAGASYCIPKIEGYGEHLPRLIKLSQEQQQSFKAKAESEDSRSLSRSGTRNAYTRGEPTTEYKGQIVSTTMPRLLRTFYQQQSTGALYITRDNVDTSLYFVEGSIVFASSSATENRLGESLVKSGRISQDDYDTACKLMATSGMRFGTALTTLGIIRLEDLKPLVVQHILRLLYSTFDWDTGDFIFEHGTRLENEVMLSLSTADVIFAGIRHLNKRSLIDNWLGDCDRILIPTTDPFALFQALTLRPEEAAVLERMDKPMSVNQVRSIEGLNEEVVSRTLCGLIETGMLVPFEARDERLVVEMPKFAEIFDSAPLPVDFDARAAAEFCYEVELTLQRFRAGDHYKVLGIDYDATLSQITAAYQALAKKFHPDRHSQLASYNLNLKTDLKAIFERLAEAYYTLTDGNRRIAYNRSINAPARIGKTAEPGAMPAMAQGGTKPLPPFIPGMPGSEEYEVALDHFAKRDFDKARKALLQAIAADPDNPEYRVALARSLLKLPLYIRQAEDAYLKAIELAPNKADYYAELGLLYQQFSQVAQARNMMQRALELDPHNPIALRSKF